MKTLIILSLMISVSSYAKKIVFLGDSNTALTYLMPKNNKNVQKDFRFTALLTDKSNKKTFYDGIETVNTAVGGAVTRDFLEHGQYFDSWHKERGDIYVICFGLNDAPKKVPKSNYEHEYFEWARDMFRYETDQLINLVKFYSPKAEIYLMTNVDVNYEMGHFQYDRSKIIDLFDDVYRKMIYSYQNVDIIDTNYYLKKAIDRNNHDLRIRRSPTPVLDASEDNSSLAKSMPYRLWRTNVHYNKNGSTLVAQIIKSVISKTPMPSFEKDTNEQWINPSEIREPTAEELKNTNFVVYPQSITKGDGFDFID